MRKIPAFLTYTYRRKRRLTWRLWFAWRPVKVDNKTTWLKFIMRRNICEETDLYDIWKGYEYKLKEVSHEH